MLDPRLADHATGVEMEIVELVERQRRADAEGWHEEAGAIQAQIDALHAELAQTSERLAETTSHPAEQVA